MADLLRLDHQVKASVVFETEAGKPAKVDGVPVWKSSHPEIVSVVASADGMSAVIAAVAEGEATVSMLADAKVGPDIVELPATVDIVVADEQATVARISLGEPEPVA